MKRSKDVLGIDPLDAVLEPRSGPVRAQESREAVSPSEPPNESLRPPMSPSLPLDGAKRVKKRATFHLPVELLDRVRDAVVALSGPPDFQTMAGFAEEALRRELMRLSEERNRGRSFPKRRRAVKSGRPVA